MDDVRSFAKNLERRGRGLRLEVRDHLGPSFRVLQSVGYHLKQKHPGLKRNVLFDDERKNLKLDVCTGADQPWRTIYPDGARQSLTNMGKTVNAARAALSPGEIDNLLAAGDHYKERGRSSLDKCSSMVPGQKAGRIYCREGRYHQWKALMKKSRTLVRKRAAKYWENQKKTYFRAFFKNIKAYTSKEKPPTFNVRSLFSDSEEISLPL